MYSLVPVALSTVCRSTAVKRCEATRQTPSEKNNFIFFLVQYKQHLKIFTTFKLDIIYYILLKNANGIVKWRDLRKFILFY